MRYRQYVLRSSRVVSGLVLAATLFVGPASPVHADDWNPGPFAAGDSTPYAGSIDYPTSGSTVTANTNLTMNGWVVDRSAEGWAGIDEVDIYSGTAGAGGTFLGKALVAQSRPDVGTALGNSFYSASGWVFTIPAGKLPQGPTTLNVYAHTPSKGWWFRSVSFTVGAAKVADQPEVVIQAPVKGEKILTSKSEYLIYGWAIDRNAPKALRAGVNRVQVYLGAPKDDPNTVYLGDAQLGIESAAPAQAGDQFSNGGWSLSISPTQYHTNNYNLYVYARSAVTGKESDAIVNFDIQDS